MVHFLVRTLHQYLHHWPSLKPILYEFAVIKISGDFSILINGICSFFLATCLTAVVWDKEGHASWRVLLLQQIFLCHLSFMENLSLSCSRGTSGHPQFFG